MEKKTINVKQFPLTPGVYLMCDRIGRVLYVGKAVNLKNRVSSYFTNPHLLTGKTKQMVEFVSYVDTIQTISEFDALLLEAQLIKKYKTKYNVIWRDDKHPLYIKITSGDEFPKIFTSRREDDLKSTFFGPFPSASTARGVLLSLRRVFPYCTQKKIGKRGCFYTHIGLCNPCPADVVKLPEEERLKQKKIYRLSIRRLLGVLSGKSTSVIKELENEMEKLSKVERFEEAGVIRDRIRKLKYVTERRFKSEDYLENPNLAYDVHKRQAEELFEILKKFSETATLPYKFTKPFNRIECYDISNFSGQKAVGSMVVFVDGEKRSEYYRKFRIRQFSSPNDPGMMSEVLKRRLGHPEWPFPDLLVVDGGKTQVAAAREMLAQASVVIPFVGLAKRLEEIVVPLKDGGFTKMSLPHSSRALQLLEAIRDEAHRFAVSYHRHLRKV